MDDNSRKQTIIDVQLYFVIKNIQITYNFYDINMTFMIIYHMIYLQRITFLEHNLSRVMPFGPHNIGRLRAEKAKNHHTNCSCLLLESTVSINPICSQRNKSKNIFKNQIFHKFPCISYAFKQSP